MRFTFSDEQEQLRTSVRKLLAGAQPRRWYEGTSGTDRGLWDGLAEMGVCGLGVDATLGGSGGNVVDQVAVAEEIGRALAPVPFLTSTMVAGPLAMASAGAEPAARIAKGIATGKLIVAATTDEAGGRDATAEVDGWRVSGVADLLIDGPVADVLLVDARVDGASGLFAVEAGAAGLTVTSLPALDRTRPLARVELDGAPAEILAEPGEGTAAALAAARSRAELGLAAEALGVAAVALEMSAEYAKNRRQFGLPIGTFQAVKHRVADMLVGVENARSAVAFGAWALAENAPDAFVAVAMAKATATENAVRVAGDAIQVFGGIGCTWEHDIHLYLRRAKSCALLLGEPAAHFERIASHLLDD